ncbi:MAG: peptidase MA family metallohydrolase [Gemmatimonadales bacterium]
MQRPAPGRRCRGNAVTLALHLIALLNQGGPPIEPDRRVLVGDVTAFTDNAHVALATSLAQAASVPHSWIGIGHVDAGQLLIVLARNGSEFERWSRGRLPKWGAGAAFPGSGVILIRLDAGDPFQTLRHELAHMVLHRNVRERVPLWFDEGYAVLASQEYGRFAALRLNLAVAAGHLPDLRALDGALRGDDLTAETAYALAGSAVDEIRRRSRNADLGTFMALLERNVPFDDALHAGTGFTTETFEEAWQRSLRQRYNWVVWLATGGMWLLVSLALVWVAAMRRRREAPRRAALDVGWSLPPEDDETITIQDVKSPST